MTKSLKASLRKGIVGIVMMTTIFSLSGVVALVPTANAATFVTGDLIRNPSAAGMAQFDVYVVKVDGTKMYKRLILSPAIFNSYGGLFKWANVKTVSTEEMNQFKTSGLVRIETNPQVYAVSPVAGSDTGSKSWLNVSGADFAAAGGDWTSVYTINTIDGSGYSAATDLTTSAQVVTYLTTGALPGVTPPPVVGNLNVSLAADTPATGTLISGATAATSQSGADLMHFTLTGTGTVTGVALKRIGVSADTTLSNVYLFDGATRITDAASVSTGSTINFNNIAGLTVNGSKTISVKADIAANSAGQTVGVQLTAVTLTSGVVGGALPINGNGMSIASATLASVALAASTGSGNTDPGTGIVVWQSTATVSTRDVLLTRLALRQVGSIVSTDIKNFNLLVDGTQVASAASLDSNGYVTFTLSKALATGGRILKVTADVIGGSGRTVQMSLRAAYDVSLTDTQYGAGSTATGTFPNNPTAFTLSSGSMTVVKATGSQSTNLTVGAPDQSLATYTLSAFGEPIKVETLRVGIVTNGTPANVTLQNVKIMVNGGQVGSNTNVPADVIGNFTANTGTQFTTNFTVVPGTPATVEIRGDMVDTTDAGGNVTDDIAAGTVTSVQAVLVQTTGNGVPQVTITAVDVPTGANVLGNSLTIARGSITLAQTTNYGTQTIVTPQTAFKIGSYVLTGNATEAVNLNTVYVGFTAGSTATEAADLSSLYVTYGATSTTPKGTVSATILNGNSWSINQQLAVNQSMTFDVFATIATSLNLNSIITTLAVAGTTAQSGITVYADSDTSNNTLEAGFTGQTITGGAGSIAASVDASTPASALVDDFGTVSTAAFKFAATNDNYTITDMTVTLGNATAVSTVNLMDGTTSVVGGSKAANTTVTYSGLNIPVIANQSKVITVQLVMSTVGVGAGATGASLVTTLTGATAKNSAGTNSTPTGLPQAANAMYVYKALPIITNVALPTTVLAPSGTITLSKFSIASSGGSIGWAKLIIDVTKNFATANKTITAPTLWDVTSGATQVTSTGSFVTTISGADNNAGSITIIPSVEQQISGSKTYEVRATLGGGVVAVNDSVTAQIKQVDGNVGSTTAFEYNAASGFSYYDVATSGTVATTDIRAQATAAYTTATVVSAGGVVGHNSVNKIVKSYGVTGNISLALAEGTTANKVGATAFTTTGAGSTGLTCTPYTNANYTGAVVANTTDLTAIVSVQCVGTGMQLDITGITVDVTNSTAGASNDTLTIAITKAANYASGSPVQATDSDVGLATTVGVTTDANFVWSDLSAASHSLNTSDWTNGYLVQNLPTSTQSLIR